MTRGPGRAGPFSRCTVEDDVFALACLAYEMLAGRHPFNFDRPAKARETAMEPERIAGVPPDQWGAIRRALSFHPEQQTATVADFMHELGIRGTERLHAIEDEPDDVMGFEAPVADAPDPVPASPGIGVLTPVPASDETVAAPAVPAEKPAATPRRTAGMRRAGLLGLLLAALVAWVFLGDAEDRAVAVVAFVDDVLDLGLAEQDAVVVTPAARPATVPPDDGSMTPTAESTETPVVPGEPFAEGDGRVIERTDESPGITAAGPAPEAIEADDPLADETTAPADTAQAATPSVAAPVFITVSERDVAARIVIERTGIPPAGLVWWTSDHSALADEDFIAVPQQAMSEVPGSDAVLVPLVNDGLAESTESFFVNFGVPDAIRGSVERLAIVRVDVVDDD